jgi:hypothetical protein
VYIRGNARARLFSFLLGKGRFVCTAAQSIAAVELLLLLLLLLLLMLLRWDQEGKKSKKGDRICSEQLPLQISCDNHESSIVVLLQVGFGVCKAIRAP